MQSMINSSLESQDHNVEEITIFSWGREVCETLHYGLGKVSFMFYEFYVSTNFYLLVSDAYGSVPLPGVLEGNYNSLGDFNSCVELEADVSHIQGKYCSMEVSVLESGKAFMSPLIPGGNVGINVCKGL